MLRAAAYCLILLLAACGRGEEPAPASRAALVEDQFAYHVGVLAYLYGYPMVDSYRREVNAKAGADKLTAPTEFDPMRSLGFFETFNALLRKQPAPPGTEALMAQFNRIGVGPESEFDQGKLTPASKRGLARAIRDARVMIESAEVDGEPAQFDFLALAARHRAALRAESASP